MSKIKFFVLERLVFTRIGPLPRSQARMDSSSTRGAQSLNNGIVPLERKNSGAPEFTQVWAWDEPTTKSDNARARNLFITE